MSKATQRGFTLIELVVVIVILGILAAFAVPRFVNLEGQARRAAVGGLEGSLRSAASLSRALYLASGSPTAPAEVTMEGQTITMVNGYPNRATIDNTLATHSGFTYVEGTGVFTLTGGTNCTVTYTEAAANSAPTIASNPACQ